MKNFEECQHVLVVDGKNKTTYDDFDVINVPRINNQFNWSNMWAAGVGVAKHRIIWYLDSDRLLPSNYIELLFENVVDDAFVFTSTHFMLKKELPFDLCKEFLESKEEGKTFDDRFLGAIEFEPRFREPLCGPGKGVMSGNTAFTADTFYRLGGVDSWYCGHGAYADTDFHRQASQAGCKFIDLQVSELHDHHYKLGEDQVELDRMTLWRLSLDNFIYYCMKWGIDLNYAEEQAFKCSILKPKAYVAERVKALRDAYFHL